MFHSNVAACYSSTLQQSVSPWNGLRLGILTHYYTRRYSVIIIRHMEYKLITYLKIYIKKCFCHTDMVI